MCYINRRLVENMPMMACAIRENEEIRTIIMIWQLPWEKMTLGQSSVLTVTSMLIQNAILRAQRFLEIWRFLFYFCQHQFKLCQLYTAGVQSPKYLINDF